MTSASAAGKAILFGEHAVVYGRAALAVPLSGLRATVEITDLAPGEGIWIEADDIGVCVHLADQAVPEAAVPLQLTTRNALRHLGLVPDRVAWKLAVHSDIPVARGLGSGTAVATALVRAIAAHCGRAIAVAEVSALVFETEVLLHGTPSGVDNTVVAYEAPLCFRQGRAPEFVHVGAPLTLLVADTGIIARTRDAVGAVRAAWQAGPARYEALFDGIETIVVAARAALAAGEGATLGCLMSENQRLLAELGVSSPELDALVAAACAAGAWGAKLSGGGRGGFMLALVAPEVQGRVHAALAEAGARQVLATVIAAG